MYPSVRRRKECIFWCLAGTFGFVGVARGKIVFDALLTWKSKKSPKLAKLISGRLPFLKNALPYEIIYPQLWKFFIYLHIKVASQCQSSLETNLGATQVFCGHFSFHFLPPVFYVSSVLNVAFLPSYYHNNKGKWEKKAEARFCWKILLRDPTSIFLGGFRAKHENVLWDS